MLAMTDFDLLIDTLGDDARPVRRPAPAARRALAWTLACLACGFLATRALHASSWSRLGPNGLFGTLGVITGVAAGALLLIAALDTSIAGRKRGVLPAAVLSMAAWLTASLTDLATNHWPMGRVGEGLYCFRFIVCASAPMTLAVIVALRQTYCVQPLRSMLLAATGTAFLAFALLAFCHHGRLRLMDFSMHFAAVALVIAVSAGLGWRLVSIPRGGRFSRLQLRT